MNRTTQIDLQALDVTVSHRVLFHVENVQMFGGEIWGLVGPNGRGKTTLLRLIAGLTRPSKGIAQVTLNAPSKRQMPMNETHSTGGQGKILYLASQPALLLDQTVNENLEFYANAFGFLPAFKDFDKVLSVAGLEGRSKQIVRSLSTGQKRRLTFAALVLISPEVLIADEPTNGLDADGRSLCASLFQELKANGSVVLVATHDAELLLKCDKVLDVLTLGSNQNAKRKISFL